MESELDKARYWLYCDHLCGSRSFAESVIVLDFLKCDPCSLKFKTAIAETKLILS